MATIFSSSLSPSSTSLVGWTTSAVLHVVVVGGLAQWGASSWMGVAQSGLNSGQAITLQARFAGAPESSEWAILAEVVQGTAPPSLGRESRDLAPQPIEITRTAAPHQPQLAISLQSDLPETLLAEIVVEQISASQRAGRADAPKPENNTAQPRTTRQIAPPSAGAEGYDASDVAPSIAGANIPPTQLAGNAAPIYPLDAQNENRQGRVVIRALISPTGTVAQAEIASSSGAASLDASALAAVRRWQFSPARRNGQPIEHELRIPVRFRIER